MWILDKLAELINSGENAIIHREEKISFRELWRRSEAITGFLMENRDVFGIDQKTPIVIYGNKESDIVACMHAALKTGVAYVPVDTSYPVERLLMIMEQVNAKVLFDFSDRAIHSSATIIRKDRLNTIFNDYASYQSDQNLWVKDEDDCYILFTSGSTGKPKGIAIKKKNILNYVDWVSSFAIPDAKTPFIAMNQISYSFDVSTFALYVYLSSGNAIYSFDKEMLVNMPELFDYLGKSNLGYWVSTPSFLEICCHERSFNKTLLPNLKKIIVAGEVLTKKLVKEIRARFPDTVVINGYGPTECTVLLTACEITDEMVEDEDSLPIGKLIPDGTFELLNPFEKDGRQIGELAVVSQSVSCGYYHNEEKTRQSYWYDQDRKLYGYKTGDLVYVKNGYLYYIGRKDFQIKLNGYRIELGDISLNMNKLPYISNNIVIPIKDSDGKISYLMDVYSLKEKISESNLKLTIRIKKDLAKLVPIYMVPKKFVKVESFPLNVNGKIDRKKLLEELQ